jgi:hypothetical protein
MHIHFSKDLCDREDTQGAQDSVKVLELPSLSLTLRIQRLYTYHLSSTTLMTFAISHIREE